jgi:hypothetical protein
MKKTLYHGSSIDVDVLEPVGINMGTRLQNPHWVVYFWDTFTLAHDWAVFQTLRRGLKSNILYHIPSGKIMLTRKVYMEIVKQAIGLPYFVYTAHVPLTKVGVGSSPHINEYTVKTSVSPEKKDIFTINTDTLSKACLVSTDTEIKNYIKDMESGVFDRRRGILLSILLDPKKDLQRHSLMKKVRSGEIIPGDKLSSKW